MEVGSFRLDLDLDQPHKSFICSITDKFFSRLEETSFEDNTKLRDLVQISLDDFIRELFIFPHIGTFIHRRLAS